MFPYFCAEVGEQKEVIKILMKAYGGGGGVKDFSNIFLHGV